MNVAQKIVVRLNNYLSGPMGVFTCLEAISRNSAGAESFHPSRSFDEWIQLKKLLLTALGSNLSVAGYELRRMKDSFIREHETAHWIYQLVFLKNGIGWRIQPNVGVRIERVEEIFHQTSGFEVKYQKDTPTIGGFVGSIKGGTNRDCEFLLIGKEDVPRVADALIRVLHDFAVSRFD